MVNQQEIALRLLNSHLGTKPAAKVFKIEDKNAADIMEMQGARLHRGRNYDVAVLPEPLASDAYFNQHTLPYVKPGRQIPTISEVKQQVMIESPAGALGYPDYIREEMYIPHRAEYGDDLNEFNEALGHYNNELKYRQAYFDNFRNSNGGYPTQSQLADYLEYSPYQY